MLTLSGCSTYAHFPVGRNGSWKSVVDEIEYHVHKKIVSKLLVRSTQAVKNKEQSGWQQRTNEENKMANNRIETTTKGKYSQSYWYLRNKEKLGTRLSHIEAKIVTYNWNRYARHSVRIVLNENDLHAFFLFFNHVLNQAKFGTTSGKWGSQWESNSLTVVVFPVLKCSNHFESLAWFTRKTIA